MNLELSQTLTEFYKTYNFQVSEFLFEKESEGYDACQFKLNGSNILSRKAKITPKKAGQFVVFWKRKGRGPIEPYHEKDTFDFFVVNVQTDNAFGQFVFPKRVLMDKGIITTAKKEGKRAFRVYPIWDKINTKQAEQTQKWQLDNFIELNEFTDPQKFLELYK